MTPTGAEASATVAETSATPCYPTLVVERIDTVLHLCLDRPEVLNAFSSAMISDVSEALEWGGSWARVVVVSGAGRAFSAGGDLAETRLLLDHSHEEVRRFYGSIDDLLRAWEALTVPTIAAVHGYAIAGGLELALACDLVVAGEGAVFGDGHARYGLVPGGGSCTRLVRRLGAARATDLLFTGRHVPASTMAQWGLVSKVVADQDVVPAALQTAEDLARLSAPGLVAMKTVVREGASLSLEASLDLERELCARHVAESDYREGLTAFAERREPVFADGPSI